MIKLLPILVLTVLLLPACNSSESNSVKEKEKYQQAKETLAEKERKNPAAFLMIDSHDKHNLIGQTVVKGTISNRAKICVYKDVELELSFYSTTGTLLTKTNETVYDNIEPGKSVSFKAKEFAPKGSDSVAIKVLRAKAD